MAGKTGDYILDYGHHAAEPHWVSLYRFYGEVDAQLFGNELESNGIRYQILNGSTRSTLSFYGAMVTIDLQVLSDDLERAGKVLAEHIRPEAANDLEPAEYDDPSQPRETTNDAGETVQLLSVGAYESVHEMREAALILEAGRINAYVPRLVSRGEKPASAGARFILRVQEDDLLRSRSLLTPQNAEEAAGEPRCPRCGAWNVFDLKHEFANLLLGFIGRSKPEQCECLKCHYIGLRPEFLHTVAAANSMDSPKVESRNAKDVI